MTTSNQINSFNSIPSNNNTDIIPQSNTGSGNRSNGRINNSPNSNINCMEKSNPSSRTSSNPSPISLSLSGNINHCYSNLQQQSHTIQPPQSSGGSNGYHQMSMSTYPTSNNYSHLSPPHPQINMVQYHGLQNNSHIGVSSNYRPIPTTNSSSTGNNNGNNISGNSSTTTTSATTTATPTAMNRSQRCGICRGCQCKPCGHCTYCQDSPQFGGPGVKKQSCIERRCLRVLENRLQRDSPTFKARLGCNNCDDCRLADCQVCLVCLDKRFFDNKYMTGALCAKKRCNNATSIELPCQIGNNPQERSLKRNLDHNSNGYEGNGKRRSNGNINNNNNNYTTNQQMALNYQQPHPQGGMNLMMGVNGMQQLPPTTIPSTATNSVQQPTIQSDPTTPVTHHQNTKHNTSQPTIYPLAVHDENISKKGNQIPLTQQYPYQQIPQQSYHETNYPSQMAQIPFSIVHPSKYHTYQASNNMYHHHNNNTTIHYPHSTYQGTTTGNGHSYQLSSNGHTHTPTTTQTPMNGSPINGSLSSSSISSYNNANFYDYDTSFYQGTFHPSTSADPYLPPSYTPELKNNVVIQQL
uniref:CXXC-type domain-containing protein n=1 Tax=Strongyloides venezuelensis TaxID=75913 RepID=A0A0K0G0B7_STRVS